MLTIPPPMSNTERQRKFRKSHPGYFKKYYGRKKSIEKHVKARMQAEAQAAKAARDAARAEATLAILVKPQPLMLPAPVQDPTMAAIDALAAALGYSARQTADLAAASARLADRSRN
jgi:hypothetical protein